MTLILSDENFLPCSCHQSLAEGGQVSLLISIQARFGLLGSKDENELKRGRGWPPPTSEGQGIYLESA